jgi:transposase
MKRNRYDESFKSEAVILALSGELSYAEVARDLGIKYGTLMSWIHSSMNNPKPTNKADKSGKASKPYYQALEHQNRAMHKELEMRKKEIEFLKKASAYFASLKP